MKLIYYDLNLEIELSSKNLACLIIEHPRKLEEFLIELSNAINKKDSRVELLSNYESVDIHLHSELILSPFDLVYSKKDVQKKLLSELLLEINNSEYFEKFGKVLFGIIDEIEKFKLTVDYELDYDDNFSISELLKSFNLMLVEPEGTFIEKFIDYVKNIHRLLGKDIFFLMSCMQFMNEKDMEYLEEFAKYENIIIVFIESYQKQVKIPMNKYIIDSDLCEIHE